jgi:structural maintenance of chromosome 3 (chondroitin sulfate proteoglycan 6)
MHIKQIIIQGFKTYRDQTIVGPLSPSDNIFVGLNGHGKSNFFNAIMFVLSDKYSNIRQEEKQRLIYEGAGEPVESASVEVIFDNTDGRLPIDKSTVSIKRVLKAGKDDYYIDAKSVSKNEIHNLLESAGFSRTNPYYIIQQGRISSIAAMNEAQCLDLLKEVAGTKVYDERRKESEKIIEETHRKRQDVEQVMERIKERIAELDRESEDLKKYQTLEKTRRALEYILYKHHVVDAQEQLEAVNSTRDLSLGKINTLKISRNNLQEEIDQKDGEIKSRQHTLNKLQEKLQLMEDENSKLQSQRAALEQRIYSHEEHKQHMEASIARLRQDMKDIAKSKETEEGNIASLMPEYKKLKAQEQQISENLHKMKRRREQLFDKQGSMIKFKSLEERNEFLMSEIQSLNDIISENSQRIAKEKDNISRLEATISSSFSSKPKIEAQISQRMSIIEECDSSISSIKNQRSQNSEEINYLKQDEHRLKTEIDNSSSRLSSAKFKLQSVLPRSFGLTLDKLDEACKELPGYYGVLLDLIIIPPKFQTCADVATKLKAFAVVVDSFETAREVLDINNKLGGERISIYPLEWISDLNIKDRNYPNKTDAIPLINQIELKEDAPPELERIVRHIFGKVVLVRNYEVANKFARDFSLHCVTPDGYMIYSGGYIMKAGFHDIKKEKLRAYNELAELKTDHALLLKEYDRVLSLKAEFLDKDTELLKYLQDFNIQKENERQEVNKLKASLVKITEEYYDIHQKVENKKETVVKLEQENVELKKNIEEVRQDMEKTEVGQLSKKEAQELEELMRKIGELEKDLAGVHKDKITMENELKNSEMKVKNLIPGKEKRLLQKIFELEQQLEYRDQNSLKQDLVHIKSQITQNEARSQTVSAELKDLQSNIKDLVSSLQSLKEKESKIASDIEEEQVISDKLLNRFSQLTDRKEDYCKKMGTLGSLPVDIHEQYKNESPTSLMRLIECNSKEFKKYMHVNKSAIEQYSRFSDKLENLTQKIAELNDSDKSIQDLLKHLDKVKDDAIVKTFRSVAQHFSEVFHELEPQGRGRLKMIKGEGVGVNKYIGVSINVSFSRNTEAVYKMQQLSGGEKTIVVIAFIIAIQRADPAPFYVFDELDAALDPQKGFTLANLITRSAKNAQFIMTTFKPELCKNADKVFEVRFRNRASEIRSIERERAFEVIQNEGNERAFN